MPPAFPPEPMSLGTVIVTGGASGLGEAVALAIREAGGSPVVLDVNAPQHGLSFEQVDLTDTAATEEVVRRVAEQAGDLTGVVTAAGTDACGKLDEVATDAWERVVKVNLLGTAAVVRAALPFLEGNSGRIVTVASTLGFRALSDASAYCASKFGVVGFSRALMAELGDRVGVTMLVPAGMQTHFFDGRPDDYKPGPDAKLMDPRDVAEAVVFALTRPPGTELRELVMTVATEPSWP